MQCLAALRAIARSADRHIRRLQRCESGSPTIEFAVVAPAFIALLLAILHVALIFVAQQGLETAAESSARLLMTGQAQTYAGTDAQGHAYTGMTQADFKTAACNSLPKFLTCNRLYVDVTTVNAFSAAVTSAPSMTYSNGNVTNTFNYNPGASNGTSAQSQIVVLKLMYMWPVPTGPLGFNLADQGNGNRMITASSVLLTENF